MTEQEKKDRFIKRWGFQIGEGQGIALFNCTEKLEKELTELLKEAHSIGWDNCEANYKGYPTEDPIWIFGEDS